MQGVGFWAWRSWGPNAATYAASTGSPARSPRRHYTRRPPAPLRQQTRHGDPARRKGQGSDDGRWGQRGDGPVPPAVGRRRVRLRVAGDFEGTIDEVHGPV